MIVASQLNLTWDIREASVKKFTANYQENKFVAKMFPWWARGSGYLLWDCVSK